MPWPMRNPGLVAMHFAAAGDDGQSAEFAIRQAHQQVNRSQNVEAVTTVTDCLERAGRVADKSTSMEFDPAFQRKFYCLR